MPSTIANAYIVSCRRAKSTVIVTHAVVALLNFYTHAITIANKAYSWKHILWKLLIVIGIHKFSNAIIKTWLKMKFKHLSYKNENTTLISEGRVALKKISISWTFI